MCKFTDEMCKATDETPTGDWKELIQSILSVVGSDRMLDDEQGSEKDVILRRLSDLKSALVAGEANRRKALDELRKKHDEITRLRDENAAWHSKLLERVASIQRQRQASANAVNNTIDQESTKEFKARINELEQAVKVAENAKQMTEAKFDEQLHETQRVIEKQLQSKFDKQLAELRAQQSSNSDDSATCRAALQKKHELDVAKLKKDLQATCDAEVAKLRNEQQAAAKENEKVIKRHEDEALRLQEEVKKQQLQLGEKETEKSHLLERVAEAEFAHEKISASTEQLEQTKNALEQQVTELQQENTHKTRELDAANAALMKQKMQNEQFERESAEHNQTQQKLGAVTEKMSQLQAQLVAVTVRLSAVQSKEQEMADLLRDGEAVRRKLNDQVLQLKGNVRVFCRVRPSSSSQAGSESGSQQHSNLSFPDAALERKQIAVLPAGSPNGDGSGAGNSAGGKELMYSYDRVFECDTTQEQVFDEVSPLVQSAVDGHKVCVFAYGHTGSGKTYTMQGLSSSTTTTATADQIAPSSGVIPRAVAQVFERARAEERHGWRFSFEVSMLEIYNDMLRDLLPLPTPAKATQSPSKAGNKGGKGGSGMKLEIKLDGKGNPIAQGLSVHRASSIDEVLALLALASSRRNVSNNGRNATSSRSHSVFTLKIRREMVRGSDGSDNSDGSDSGGSPARGRTVRKEGVLNLIDLAGSERLSPQEQSRNPALKRESNAINKSLSTLGRVITAIAGKEKQVPYRDSKLTFLLKPSLGGNCKTLMICNIAPDDEQRPETIRSLRFANQVIAC
jgi:kinesin family protein C1